MFQIRKIVALAVTFTLLTPLVIFGQRDEWSCLEPLKSTRADVERILGKPDKYFDTSGTYHTDYGRYTVWYATGYCKGTKEGRDWNVAAGTMTSLLVQPTVPHLINEYLSNLRNFERRESPGGYSRFLYLSKDESLIYQTIKRKDSSEFISTIGLEPTITQKNLLCAANSR